MRLCGSDRTWSFCQERKMGLSMSASVWVRRGGFRGRKPNEPHAEGRRTKDSRPPPDVHLRRGAKTRPGGLPRTGVRLPRNPPRLTHTDADEEHSMWQRQIMKSVDEERKRGWLERCFSDSQVELGVYHKSSASRTISIWSLVIAFRSASTGSPQIQGPCARLRRWRPANA